MKAKMLIQLFGLCSVFALATGCSTQQSWAYHANNYPAGNFRLKKSVAVPPFEDARTNKNVDCGLLSFVPIIPLGWQDLNTPEGTSMHANSGSWPNFKPTEDFAKALAEDLKNTGIFSDAFFDYRIGNAEYAVKGKIMSTKYKSRIVTYGLGLYGGILWFIGLPATWTENELAVNLSLVDSKTDHNLFSKDYVAIPRKKTSWAYHFKSDFEYAEMLAELNKQFCTDIEPFLEKVAKDSKTNSVTSDK